ncbi:uncharacterized protein STEHIDRAFT_36928, partial [Stereum hirsutum FP-91666 SS1]|uniref:uncharacterized protein n=1 Tax=Stereum hirsutum (strain FP-91666) TaxID=721885 RepID=UPI000444A4DE
SAFGCDGFAKAAVAMSSITAGIGLCTDAWFLLAYSCANADKFKALAMDVYQSFFFFSIASRLPIIMLVCASMSSTAVLIAIAW